MVTHEHGGTAASSRTSLTCAPLPLRPLSASPSRKSPRQCHIRRAKFVRGASSLLPEFNEVAHVALLEGGEHGGRVLRILQTGGDTLAHARHLGAALGPISDKGGGGGERIL